MTSCPGISRWWPLRDRGGQIGFERYEGGPKPEFVVTAIGTDRMPVEQLQGIFGFPTKAWTQLDPEDYKPTPIERALEQWHQAKQDQLKDKQKAGEALLAMRDAGLSYRGMAKVLGPVLQPCQPARHRSSW